MKAVSGVVTADQTQSTSLNFLFRIEHFTLLPKVTAGLGKFKEGVTGFPSGEGSLGCRTEEGLKWTRIPSQAFPNWFTATI